MQRNRRPQQRNHRQQGGQNQHRKGLRIERQRPRPIDVFVTGGDVGERLHVLAAEKAFLVGAGRFFDPFLIKSPVVPPDQRAEFEQALEAAAIQSSRECQ